jgi:hypothetical protein
LWIVLLVVLAVLVTCLCVKQELYHDLSNSLHL